MHGWCVCVHGWCVCVHACMWIKCTVIMYKQDTSGLCHHLVLIAYIVTCKNREEALTEIIKHALNNILLCMQMTWIPARRNHLDSLSYLWHKISQSASPLHYFRYCSWSKLRNEVRKFFFLPGSGSWNFSYMSTISFSMLCPSNGWQYLREEPDCSHRSIKL